MVVKIISIEQSAFSVEPAISLGNLLCAAKGLGSIHGLYVPSENYSSFTHGYKRLSVLREDESGSAAL